jgi:uncharacterized protein (DUF697 family)
MTWLDSLNAAAKGPKKTVSEAERRKIAQDLVMMSSMGAAAMTYAPIPLMDFVLVTPVQASMVMAVGRVYGRELNLDESKHILVELASVCGLGLLAQKGFATLTKILLPGFGGVLAGPYAFAVTYGMGHVAMSYFEDKDAKRDALKKVFHDAMADAKKIFSREKLDEFRKKRGQEVTDFVNKVTGKTAAPKKAAPKKRKPAKKKAARS